MNKSIYIAFLETKTSSRIELYNYESDYNLFAKNNPELKATSKTDTETPFEDLVDSLTRKVVKEFPDNRTSNSIIISNEQDIYSIETEKKYQTLLTNITKKYLEIK